MSSGEEEVVAFQQAALLPVWDFLLRYPCVREIPLQTIYNFNVAIQNQLQCPILLSPVTVAEIALSQKASNWTEQHQISTKINATTHLRTELSKYNSQVASQPTLRPLTFILDFIRHCCEAGIEWLDSSQALDAIDYLKDLEVSRRHEVAITLSSLGIEREEIIHPNNLARRYPGILSWLSEIQEKERKVEALYSQVYLDLRHQTLVNELFSPPFNSGSCLAMLNTLYPPVNSPLGTFMQPTIQLTPQILNDQRNGFFGYIKAAGQQGTAVLASLMDRDKASGVTTERDCLRCTVDTYIRMAISIIEECYEITGRGPLPTSASCKFDEFEDRDRFKVESGGPLILGSSSNHESCHRQNSHVVKSSSSCSFHIQAHCHDRCITRDEKLSEKSSYPAKDDDPTTAQKNPSPSLRRIAGGWWNFNGRITADGEQHPREFLDQSRFYPARFAF